MNVYRMGRNAIERGSRDSWTAGAAAGRGGPGRCAAAAARCRRRRSSASSATRASAIRAATSCPSDQPDFLTALKFAGALLETGVTVHRATADFTVQGRRYPAGSLVVKTAQAFRPHVLDMFEPQEHPHDLAYPGGPPVPPYDNAGWTLAFQMGVKFDRVLDGFDGPFEAAHRGQAAPGCRAWRGGTGRLSGEPPSERRVRGRQPPAARRPRGVLARGPHRRRRARRHRRDVHPGRRSARRLAAGARAGRVGSGARLHRRRVAAGGRAAASSSRCASDCGIATAARARAGGSAGCSSATSSRSRWCIPPTLDTADLASRFDVLILPTDAVPEAAMRRGGPVRARRRASRGPRPGRRDLVGPDRAAR